MKYKYKIKNLKLFGYHGVFDSEKNNGQDFLLNISYKSQPSSIIGDHISNVIDYSNICKDVESIFNSKRYNLLESLANDIKLNLESKYENTIFSIEIIKSSKHMKFSLDSISVKIWKTPLILVLVVMLVIKLRI